MNYEKYLASEQWRSLRDKVLKRDNRCCQTCLNQEDLEVHHKTYERLGNEDLSDLITLCYECHKAITNVIRQRRYGKKIIQVLNYERVTPINQFEVKQNGATKFEVRDYRSLPTTTPQWSDSRPFEPVLKGDEEDILKKIQDRRRF